MGAARTRLQEATSAIHQALHHAEPFARIAAGQMDRDGYGALLIMLHGYHASMAQLCAAGAARLDAPDLASAHQLRLGALQDDLAFCRARMSRFECAAVPDADFAVGCLYTVQGSTLGGKLIHRQLAQLLPDGQGRSFFAGHAGDGALWRLFCDRLEANASSLDFAQVEAGADHAFARFGALLRDAATIPA